METVIVKQEEEDWTYNFDGTEAELEVKTELEQDVDLQSACESTVPTLFHDSLTIKEEPIDSFKEAVTSQENTPCTPPHYVCDATIVKVEEPVTEAAVKDDVWLQQLPKQEKQDESLQHDVKEEHDTDEETPVVSITADRKRCCIPVIVGSRKFVLIRRSSLVNTLTATTNTRKEARSQLPVIARNSQIKSKLSYSIAQPPVAENVTTSIPEPVLRISITKPVTKVSIMQPEKMQSPQNTGRYIVNQPHSIPDCIFQPKIKKKTSDVSKTNLKPAMNDVIQRSGTINRILDHATTKITPLVTNECLNLRVVNNIPPLVRNSYNNSPVVSRDTQTKEPGLENQSQTLLNILETLKASKRAAGKHGKSAFANIKPIPQKTMKSNPTSVSTKIREILTYINSRLPELIEAKATLKPTRFINSIPTSQLEDFLRPCYVKLDRLKLLTCVVCREQFYLKSHFVQHVFQHVRTPSIMANVPCKICGKYYQQKYIKIHERKEHGPKNLFWCDHCGKQCSHKGSLIKHLASHSDIKLYRCDVCNKRCRTKSNLISHQQMHSTEKPYNCIICDKRFSRKTSLSKHSLYHLAVRPHQCKICDKQFCQLFHLERHILVHTGERPYACEICNMRFTRSSHRKRHMAIHTSKKSACKV